ncbi:MAG: CDP-glucose 4,6-dehydratase [Planctomycetota bacterium]|jgi:CDP-glucose 4,6-dehydratase
MARSAAKADCFSGVYKGARVLVTGHTGFKGSWLILWLKALGARVSGYSLDVPTQPSLFEASALEDQVDHTFGDVRNLDALQRIMKKQKPALVFHLAAQAIVRRSYEIPRETLETNVHGTVNLLEAARRTGTVKSLVIVTSDKCYEDRPAPEGYREDDRLGGKDPYSASKAMAELAVTAYRQTFLAGRTGKVKPDEAPGLASARAGNVIGGGDFGEDRLVPDCIRALMKDKSIGVRMPEALRPWQFVLEPLSGYLLLGAKLLEDRARFGGAWNFGPADPKDITTSQLVERLIDLWGSGTWQEERPEEPKPETELLKLNWEKAGAELDWKPLYDLDKALGETIAWYRAFQDKADAVALRKLALSQIRAFEEQARAERIAWSR